MLLLSEGFVYSVDIILLLAVSHRKIQFRLHVLFVFIALVIIAGHLVGVIGHVHGELVLVSLLLTLEVLSPKLCLNILLGLVHLAELSGRIGCLLHDGEVLLILAHPLKLVNQVPQVRSGVRVHQIATVLLGLHLVAFNGFL